MGREQEALPPHLLQDPGQDEEQLKNKACHSWRGEEVGRGLPRTSLPLCKAGNLWTVTHREGNSSSQLETTHILNGCMSICCNKKKGNGQKIHISIIQLAGDKQTWHLAGTLISLHLKNCPITLLPGSDGAQLGQMVVTVRGKQGDIT